MITLNRTSSRRSLVSLGGALAITAVASLGLAACGGSDNGSTSSTSAATSGGAAAAETVKLGETEYKLTPSDPSVKAGTVSFDVSNDGKVAHSLEVDGPNGEEQLPNDLAPGDKGTLSVDLSKPGKYEFYCPVDDHKGLGMKGEITVQ